MSDAPCSVVDANAIAIQTITSQQNAIESLQSLVQTLKEQIEVLSRNAAAANVGSTHISAQHTVNDSLPAQQGNVEASPLRSGHAQANTLHRVVAEGTTDEGTASVPCAKDAGDVVNMEVVQGLQAQVDSLTDQLARQQREARAMERRWSEDKARLHLLETFVFQREGQLSRVREELAAITLEKKRWKVLADTLTTHVPDVLQSHVQDYMRHMMAEEKERAQAAAAAEAKAAAAATIMHNSHNFLAQSRSAATTEENATGNVHDTEGGKEPPRPDALEVLSVWNSKVEHLDRGHLALLADPSSSQAAASEVSAESYLPRLPHVVAAQKVCRSVSPSQGKTTSSTSYRRVGRPSHGRASSRFLVPM